MNGVIILNKRRDNKMNVIQLAQMLEFSQKGDERGHMVIVEGLKGQCFGEKYILLILLYLHNIFCKFATTIAKTNNITQT